MKINPEQPDARAKDKTTNSFDKENIPILPPAKPLEGGEKSQQADESLSEFQSVFTPESALQIGNSYANRTREGSERGAEESLTVLEMTNEAASQQRSSRSPVSNSKAWLAWQIGAAVMVMVSGSIGFTATSLLIELPEVPDCERVYWPMASASLRLYCAELEAKNKTADSLLAAIAMLDVLPGKHPLRSEINRKIETWAAEILDLGEHKFQSGSLEKAIALAKRVPDNVAAYNLVEERIKNWHSIWSQAKAIDREAHQYLTSSRWNNAFDSARKLTNIENEYWSQIRYQEILIAIEQARSESKKLDFAYNKLKSGSLEDLILAIEKADRFKSSSYAYKEARDLIAQARQKLIREMDRAIARRDWGRLLNVANRVPTSANLQEYVRDWNYLATAGSSARIGTASSIKVAIATAEKIESDRPLHSKAQQLIRYWQLEIQDVTLLARARGLARSGSVSDLRAAIAAARGVRRYNPRYREAQKEISAWIYRIQVIEDRPRLARAYQIARSGSRSALQEAISQAETIAPNRALYREARGQIRKWRNTIQLQEDRPILARADTLARRGQYSEAIATAGTIRSNRALYNRARARMESWGAEVRARQNLQQANNLAAARTASGLIQAISLAARIPPATSVAAERNRSVNRWSEQLLNIAKDTSRTSLTRAIDLARQIPPRASAYQSARAQIIIWQNQLQTESTPAQ